MKNKKTFISLIVIITLLIISVNINAEIKNINNINLPGKIIDINSQFSSPIINVNNDGVTIHINNLKTYHMVPGQPILPMSVDIIEFPLGTRVTNIVCKTSEIKEYEITKDVVPGITPVSSINLKSI